MKADACVVGAGPGGVAAATTLARNGYEVLLIDKACFPRDKCCGDGLTTLALHELESLGLQPAAVDSWNWITDVKIRTPSGRDVVFSLPRRTGYFAATAKRLELDDCLLSIARGSGVHVLTEHSVVGATKESKRLDLTVKGREAKTLTIQSQWVIAADGAWSPLAKFLGVFPRDYRGEWQAFRQYLAPSQVQATSSTVWFERELLPGYSWSFPLSDGTVNFGFGIGTSSRNATNISAREMFASLLDRTGIGDSRGVSTAPRGWIIPARLRNACAWAHSALFVGDAAGAADPMTGEGIGQALVGGRIAAESIIEAKEEAGAVYSQRLRREFLAAFEVSILLRRALRHRKGVRIPIRLFGSSMLTRQFFALWLFEAYPRELFLGTRALKSLRRPEAAYSKLASKQHSVCGSDLPTLDIQRSECGEAKPRKVVPRG